MNLQEWRELQGAGRVETLPSGLDVTLKADYGLMDLVMDGKVSEEMEPFVDQLVDGGGVAITAAAMSQMGELVNLLLDQALTGPEGLDVEELPANDRMFLFSLLSGEAEPEAGVGVVPDGDGVLTTTEQFAVGEVVATDGVSH